MNTVTLDFETYYDRDFSLTKLTIPQYVCDPRFRVHGVAIGWPDGHTEFRTDIAVLLNTLKAQFGQDLERTIVICHHAHFDLYVLNHCYDIRPRHFTDTMLLAHHVHGRYREGKGEGASLEALAKRYGLPAKRKLNFMLGVRDPNPQQLADLSNYAKRDVEITAMLAERLLPQITRPEVELHVLMHTVRAFTERVVAIDMESIANLKQDIRDEAQRSLLTAALTAEKAANNNQFALLLETALSRTGRKIPLKSGKKGLIPATAKGDAAMQALLMDSDSSVAALAAARLAVKSEDQQQARLDTLRSIGRATGGLLPPYLQYYGAHTGRFAGGGKFNIQNLPKTDSDFNVRRLLVARPGHTFVIGDLAQIEARITAWYSGQEDMLEAFRQDRDQYSEFASDTLGCEVRKPREGDPKSVEQQLNARRKVGKEAVLGLGYGMGPLKFLNQLRAKPGLSRLFDSGELSPIKCKQIVDEYRRRYPMIPRFWRALDASMRDAITQSEGTVACLHFNYDGKVVFLGLPSGRTLRYPSARLEQRLRSIPYLDDWGEMAEYTPNTDSIVYARDRLLYGGKLCENVAQATARDIFVEALLRLEARGYTVLFHVHDEIVVEVARENAEQAKAVMEVELCRPLTWCQDLPLSCEVAIRERYGK